MYNERNKITIPTDEALDKELNKRWEPKPLGTSTEFGFVGGGKYVREMWLQDRRNILGELKDIQGRINPNAHDFDVIHKWIGDLINKIEK